MLSNQAEIPRHDSHDPVGLGTGNPYLPCGLFHPYQLDKSISIFRGGLRTVFIFILFFYGNSYKQIVKTLIRCHILRRLIWVCTFCLCPKK